MIDAAARFARLLQNPLFGPERLSVIQDSHIVVFGVGVVGAQLAEHLARLDVQLTVVDRGMVSVENLSNQLFGNDCLGQPKVHALSRHLRQSYPDCRIRAVHDDVARLGRAVLTGVDLVICALDSWVDRVRLLGFLPYTNAALIDLAVDGTGRSALARCAVYPPAGPKAACLGCRFDARALENVRRAGWPASCSPRPGTASGEAPATLATSAVGGLAAALGAIAAPRIVLGEAGSWLGRELLLDVEALTLRSHLLAPNPRCLFPHQAMAPVMAGRRELLSVDATLAVAADLLGGPAACLHLPGRSLVSHAVCAACGTVREPLRLWEFMDVSDLQCPCGGPLQPSATGLIDRFDAGSQSAILRSTWAAIGLPPQDIVIATRTDAEGPAVALLVE